MALSCPPPPLDVDYRLRIFTPGGELPFAGHPTLGSAGAWLDDCGTPRPTDRIVQEYAAGLVTVRNGEGVLSFTVPPRVHDGALDGGHLNRATDANGPETTPHRSEDILTGGRTAD
ncbi:PhzF family phenazine biosynthesis protein [Streptomyces humi]